MWVLMTGVIQNFAKFRGDIFTFWLFYIQKQLVSLKAGDK